MSVFFSVASYRQPGAGALRMENSHLFLKRRGRKAFEGENHPRYRTEIKHTLKYVFLFPTMHLIT